jgi:hypothetical protein
MLKSSSNSALQPAPPATIVLEKRSRWAPELERQFVNENVRVIGCRSFHDVMAHSVDTACGAILIDLAADPVESLRFLARRAAETSRLPVLVIGSEQTAELEWPLRDLGVTAFFARRVAAHEVAALCRRQWSNNL